MICIGALFTCLKSTTWPYAQAAHLFCDKESSLDELHKFAKSIGLKRTWFQDSSTMPHYDVTKNKRFEAIKNGATFVTVKQEAKWIGSWRFKKFYFTFGCNQPHENCYHTIIARNSDTARTRMFERFGNRWSMMYNSAEEAGVEKYNLTELK